MKSKSSLEEGSEEVTPDEVKLPEVITNLVSEVYKPGTILPLGSRNWLNSTVYKQGYISCNILEGEFKMDVKKLCETECYDEENFVIKEKNKRSVNNTFDIIFKGRRLNKGTAIIYVYIS